MFVVGDRSLAVNKSWKTSFFVFSFHDFYLYEKNVIV